MVNNSTNIKKPITSHLNSLSTIIGADDVNVGNPGTNFGQTH
jgi:hypothetical protein